MINTKTASHRCPRTFNSDGIINNQEDVSTDGPGALLDMLAEVASRTLRSESLRVPDAAAEEEKKSETIKDARRNPRRLLSMPTTQLVKRFTIFTGDELRRKYSYECNLVPGCCQKYTSFASENRARISITSHLVDHLDSLRNEREISSQCIDAAEAETGVEAMIERTRRGRNRREERDKENETSVKERDRALDGSAVSLTKTRSYESRVLGDHSYYERVREQEPTTEIPSSENIVLMVVESERVRIQQVSGLPDAAGSAVSVETRIETSLAPCKPKGKAKFIGTSKEEREMALLLMERIKKRGNPSGGNLQCRICVPPRSFTAPTTLVSHYRSHAGIKPYECRICHSVFTRRHSLKYHMLIHQNQTRFTCADCGKKFRHPSHFREHRRRHTGESPFACEDCGQRFKTRNTYKRHLKTRHGKVLTTSGELLRLTENDDDYRHETRANRERKTVVTETTANNAFPRMIVDGIVYEDDEDDNADEELVEIDLGEYSLDLEYERGMEMERIVRDIVDESVVDEGACADDDAGCCDNNNETNDDSPFYDGHPDVIKRQEGESEGMDENSSRCVVVLANHQSFGGDYLSDEILVSKE